MRFFLLDFTGLFSQSVRYDIHTELIFFSYNNIWNENRALFSKLKATRVCIITIWEKKNKRWSSKRWALLSKQVLFCFNFDR